MDLALNNLQRLICHKTNQPNKQISLKRKPKTGYFINLFPSCFVFLMQTKKHEEKYNRTSLHLIDKINQNRHGGGYLLVFLNFRVLFAYLFYLFLFF